jgi:leucyl aminopeptidase
MTKPSSITFHDIATDQIAALEGQIAIFVSPDGKLDMSGRKVNTLSRKAISRFLESDTFQKASVGTVHAITCPAGVAAETVYVIKLPRRPTRDEARKAGVALGKRLGVADLWLLAGSLSGIENVMFGLVLRNYSFGKHKTSQADTKGEVHVAVSDPEALKAQFAPLAAIAEGVFFTRDLTNEPANVLTTTTFAEQLVALEEIGIKTEVLEEKQLHELGMGSLLCVGQGSDSPSKVVVMQWNGGGDENPFALVGKGVVFDTGGISLKPGAGMWDMTMDMGGAGVVAGVMKTLALRGAKANVVGLVGLVENMPSGNAVRPGDVVTSMKGDTIEVQNTDAEGRLVLADVLWYAQERFEPTGMIDLATLTGAIIIGLGHENAGVFSNDDALCKAFLKSADTEGEGAWRLPLAPAYDDLLKSRIADMKNIGGRPAGSITAAQFLQRFVKNDTPWCHLDIAGVASVSKETK